MKRSTLLMTTILMALIGMLTAAQNVFAVDPPHNSNNSLGMAITCSSCHFSAGSTPTWATQPTTTDETFYNNLCTSCHMPSKMSDSRYIVKTHSSQNTSGKFGAWTVECRTCHNPHLQDQVSSYPTDTTANLVAGTLGNYSQPPFTATQTVIPVTASITGNWTDYTLVPNTVYPTKMYRILSNTANSITVSGVVNVSYAPSGSQFAIRLGQFVKDQLITPSGTTATVKFFTKDSSKPNSYGSSTNPANVTGICQVCHTQTASFNNRSTGTGSIQEGINHPSVITTGGICTDCHIHSEGFKGGCASCHGFPPDSVATLIFRTSGNTTITSDSIVGPGAHMKHVDSVKLVCSNCHSTGMLSGAAAGDNKINIGFNWNGDTSGSYDGNPGRIVYPYTGASTGGTNRCSNIYCHSSGQGSTSNNATPVYASPQWNVPSTGACGTCHGKTAATLTTGNHAQHLGATTVVLGCGDCHAGAANDASSYDSTNHVNKNIDVANGYTKAGAPGNGYGSCGSAAACHGSGTPPWGMNITGLDKCTVCHGTPTAGTLGSSGAKMAPPMDTAQSSTGARVGAHQAHLVTGNISSAVPCQECHIVPVAIDSAGHIKDATPGTAEVVFTNAVRANYNTVSNYAAGTCLTTYCHGNALKFPASAGTGTAPSWSDNTYINGTNTHDCAQCHTFPPLNIGAHAGKTATDCKGCHTNTNASGTGFADVTLHINKILEVTGCNGCHGQSGATGAPLIASDLLSNPSYSPTGHTVGMHPKHVTTLNYTCETCHSGNNMPTLDSKITISFTGLGSGGSYQGTALNLPYSYNAGVTTGSTQQCSNLYCHGASMTPNGGLFTSPVWTAAATGVCGACHGASAANPPTRGAHVKHTASMTATGYELACTLCHVNYSAQHVDGSSQVAFNSDNRVTGANYSGTPTMLDTYGNCSSLYCHSNGVGGNVTIGWAGSVNAECSSCHGGDNNATTKITSNSHNAHINSATNIGRNLACGECHNATVATSSNRNLVTKSVHVDKLVNVKFDGVVNRIGDSPTYEGVSATTATGAAIIAGTPGACANVYCHSIGNLSDASGAGTVVTAGGASFRSITWGGAGIRCDGCHGDGIGGGKAHPIYAGTSAGSTTANSHVKHVESSNIGCTLCHNLTTSGTATAAGSLILITGASTSHLNRVEDVSFANVGGKTGTYNATVGTKTCSTTYCHGGSTPSWGGTALACNGCHEASSTLAARHDKHYNTTNAATAIASTDSHATGGYVYSCQNCHPTSSHTTGGPAVPGIRDADIGGTRLSGATYTTGGGSLQDSRTFNYSNFGTCSTTCHTKDGVTLGSAVVTYPSWTGTNGLGCGYCHSRAGDISPTWSAPHTKHINSYSANTNLTCNACHSGTATDNSTINGIAGRNQHPNATRNIQFNAFANSSATGTVGVGCSSTYCHSNAQNPAAPAHGTIAWSGTMLADCTSCHGGDQTAATKIASGSHQAHINSVSNIGRNIACIECHNATVTANRTLSLTTGTSIHADKLVNVKFDNNTNKNGDGVTGPAYEGVSAITATGAAITAGTPGACSNVYCHSSGNLDAPTGGNIVSSGATPTFKVITWGTGGVGCDACHGDGVGGGKAHPIYAGASAGSTTANSHVKHVEDSGLGCTYCHNLTTSGTATAAGSLTLITGASTSHLNRVEDVSFANVGGKTGTYNATVGTKTCSATYCHGTGPSVGWGGTMTCNSCHQSQGSDGTATYTGKHQKHVDTAGYDFSCEACHTTGGTTHAGGPATGTNPGGGAVGASQTTEIAYTALSAGTMSTGQSYRGSTGTYKFISITNNPFLGSAVTATYSSGTTTGADALNGAITFYANGSCNGIWCHSNARPNGGVNSYATPTWGATLDCGSCHSKAGDALPSWSAPHTRHITSYSGRAEFTCTACHASTATNNTTLVATTPTTNHVNGLKDLKFSTFSNASSTGDATLHQCSNVYCHGNGTTAAPTVAVSWSGNTNCASCHQNTAALFTSGSHSWHIQYSTITCNNCHNATAADNTTLSSTTGTLNHVDKNVTILFNSASAGSLATYNSISSGGSSTYLKGIGTAKGICNTTYCHGANSGTWGVNAGSATCVKCHGIVSTTTASYTADTNRAAPGYVVTGPTLTGVGTAGQTGTESSNVSNDNQVGAHDVHLRGKGGYGRLVLCTDCHQNVVSVTTASHMNGSVNLPWSSLTTSNGALATTYSGGQCSNTYCHGSGFAPLVRGTNTSPTWTGGAYLGNAASLKNASDCGVCHASPPTASVKFDHSATAMPLGLATDCSTCHPHNGAGLQHIDGTLQGGGDCNSCHDYDVNGATYAGGVWTGGTWGKNSKDGLTPNEGWGAHAKHINHIKTRLSIATALTPNSQTFGVGTPANVCGTCHTNTGAHDTGGNTTGRLINFGDGTYRTGGAAGFLFTFGSSNPTYSGQSGTSSAANPKTCSNISCHFQTTPVWSAY